MTLLLTATQIGRLLRFDEALDALRDGFRATSRSGRPGEAGAEGSDPVTPLRVRTDLPGPGSATCVMPGLLPGIPAYTVKVNAKFPDAMPALRGVVCLHDLQTGELLALADSASVTSWRTGLAAAIGTDVLADPGAETLGFVGAGAQARTTLAGLCRLRRCRRIVAFDLDPARAADLAGEVEAPGEVKVAGDAREVARDADVVVLATWSRQPLLDRDAVRPGQHVTTLGADEPGKMELSADLLRAARVVVDDLALVVASGALGNVGLGADAAEGTLGQVLRGELPARPDGDRPAAARRPSVYAPIGLPWQDLALLWPVFRRAAIDHPTVIDLLS